MFSLCCHTLLLPSQNPYPLPLKNPRVDAGKINNSMIIQDCFVSALVNTQGYKCIRYFEKQKTLTYIF